jgi:hypothetical protein
MVFDDEVKYGWSRIPHFYRPFYVYKYATGFASAIHIAEKLLEGEQPTLNAYIEFLKSGGSDYPLELLKKSGATVNIIGGLINRDNLALSGDFALKFVNSINIDMAFLVTSGYSLESGFTCGNHSECELKQLVVKKARKVIMLMDSSKLDRTMPFTFTNLADIDVLICDSALDETTVQAAKENNVQVIIAGQQPVRA